MKLRQRILSACALAVMSAPTSAATVIYTDPATFLAALAPGYHVETFSAVGDPSSGASFGNVTFTYMVTSPQDIYVPQPPPPPDPFLGTNQPNEILVVTTTSGNIFAIAANFFNSNISDAFAPGSVAISLDDGTNITFTPTSTSANSFRGFISDAPILTLTIAAPGGPGQYAGFDNLTVGAALPQSVSEPASLAALCVGAAGWIAARRRRPLDSRGATSA